jgi:RNA polymerase sigma-B factor
MPTDKPGSRARPAYQHVRDFEAERACVRVDTIMGPLSSTLSVRPGIEVARPREGRDRAVQERVLFERYRARRDPLDREVLVDRFLPLARALAARFRHSREPNEDLFQVACLGLLNAIDRFDVNRRTAFSSYAVPTILGELRRHFRDRTWPVHVPRDLQEFALRVDRTTMEVAAAGREPSPAELADMLGVGKSDVVEARGVMLAYEPTSLDARRTTDDERDIAEVVGDDERGYAYAEQAALLDGLLRFLTARQREVVRLRVGEDLTQQEIADRVGLSQMQVSRILRQAIDRLSAVVAG